MFVHLLPELASVGSELSEMIGMIPYAPTNLVEALLFFVALLVVFSIDVLGPTPIVFVFDLVMAPSK